MGEIPITAYCDTLNRNMSTTIPILGSFPDDYALGIAKGCQYQVEYRCDMKKCPLGKAADKLIQEHNKNRALT